MFPFEKILVATDFSATSKRAVALAMDLAKKYDASLTIVHVLQLVAPTYPILMTPEPVAIEAAAMRNLDFLVEWVDDEVPRTSGVLLHGDPGARIVEYTEKHPVDLVVVGAHQRRGPSRWLMKSVAAKIARSCRTPVLTVHEGDDIGAHYTNARAAHPA